MRNIKKRWFLFVAAFVLVAAAGIHMGVKAEEDLIELLALGHPVGAPDKHQKHQQHDRAPQLLARGVRQQQHQERRPD